MGSGLLQTVWQRISRLRSIVALALLCASLAVLTPVFLQPGNLLNVARQISVLGVLAAGQTFVILTGGIDLSVGSVLAIGSIIAADLTFRGVPFPLAMLFGLLAAGAFGIANGLLVSRTRIPAFLVTLGMMNIARGATYLWTGGRQVSGFPPEFRLLGGGMAGPVPVPIIIMLAVFVAGSFVLTRTRFGRHVYAIGGDIEAARVSGVRTRATVLAVYAISGFVAGLGGLMLAGRLNSGQPDAGLGYELDTIAAAAIGGTSLMGGTGTMWGTLIGVFTIGILRNGLNLLNVSAFWQQVAVGAVLIAAVYADTIQKRLAQ